MTFCRSRRAGDQPDARSLPTQHTTTQKDKEKHPCLKRDSNLWS